MSKAVLISIRPKWCEKIANGDKTIEVRKTRPKLEPPFKCYIYCTKPKFEHEDYIAVYNKGAAFYAGGKVIGEFVCDRIEKYQADNYWYGTYDIDDDTVRETCLVNGALWEYAAGADLYGWHISDLVIYDKPKSLPEFKPWNRTECFYSDLGLAIPKCSECHTCKVERPPQSWCYVEVLHE